LPGAPPDFDTVSLLRAGLPLLPSFAARGTTVEDVYLADDFATVLHRPTTTVELRVYDTNRRDAGTLPMAVPVRLELAAEHGPELAPTSPTSFGYARAKAVAAAGLGGEDANAAWLTVVRSDGTRVRRGKRNADKDAELLSAGTVAALELSPGTRRWLGCIPRPRRWETAPRAARSLTAGGAAARRQSSCV